MLKQFFKILSLFLLGGIFTIVAQAQALVDTHWVNDNLDNNQIVLIDLRNKIDQGSYDTYVQGHIPGSIHSDYLQDGWRVSRDGVVGLLPSAEQFETLARSLGISNNTHVVIIPAGVSATDFASSARVYWSFKVFGHDKVSILNGGYTAWKQAYPNTIEQGDEPTVTTGTFTANFQPALYASTQNVQRYVEDGSAILLDGRPEGQFAGEGKHPKALKAGHIPNAQWLFQENAYDLVDNSLKSLDALEKVYAQVNSNQPVVSYCNTGHWASTNWFVLSEVLGRDNVSLYDGSMVEWTADTSNPVALVSNFDKLKAKVKSVFK